MTATAVLLLALAGAAMVGDWLAVGAGARRAEWLLKPLALLLLVFVALALDPSSDAARAALVVGLALSLVGDVALVLPSDRFVVGLGAFLVAHVAYVVALWLLGVDLGGLLVGLALVVIASATVGRRIIAGARRAAPQLGPPVAAYLGAISTMVVSAFGVGSPAAVGGALMFYASDAVLGWSRFVAEVPRGRVVVMVTYHLGQVGLVLAVA